VSMTLSQILSIVGKLDDSTGEETSRERYNMGCTIRQPLGENCVSRCEKMSVAMLDYRKAKRCIRQVKA